MMLAIVTLLVSMLLWLVGLVWSIKTSRGPFLLVFLYSGFILYFRPVIFILGLDQPAPEVFFGSDYWSLVADANLVSIVWMASLLAGLHLTRPVGRFIAPMFPAKEDAFTPGAVRIVVLFVAWLGITLNVMLIASYGSLEQFIYAVKVEKELRGAYIFREMTTLGAALSVFAWFYFSGPIGKSYGWRRVPTIYVVTLLACLACNLAWGNRANTAYLGIAAVIGYHFHVSRISVSTAVTLLTAFGGALVGLRFVRDAAFTSHSGSVLMQEWTLVRAVSVSLHAVQYDALMLAVRDLGVRFDIRDGQDFINGLVSWIPRQLWPDKPTTFHVGSWFRQIYEPNAVNGWPITNAGSWMVNFGYIGIVVGGLASAAMSNALEHAYRFVGQNPWHAAMATILAILLMNGGINTGFPQAVVMLLVPISLAYFVMRLISSRSRRRLQREHTQATLVAVTPRQLPPQRSLHQPAPTR